MSHAPITPTGRLPAAMMGFRRMPVARRTLRTTGNKKPDPVKAREFLAQAQERFATETAWRANAAGELAQGLERYDAVIRDSIGLRLQQRLSTEQAKTVASCQAHHYDVSLNF